MTKTRIFLLSVTLVLCFHYLFYYGIGLQWFRDFLIWEDAYTWSGSNLVEIVVISVHLLSAFLLLAVGYVDEGPEILHTPTERPFGRRTKKVEAENVRPFFENYSPNLAVKIKSVAVCRTPLSGPFSGSILQQQDLSVDFHASVTMVSSDGLCWAVDKMADGLWVSCGESIDSVIYFDGVKRPEPVIRLIMDESTSSLGDVVGWLEHKLPKNTYYPYESNCQHFAKEIFDKFAEKKSWKLDTITDVRRLIGWRTKKVEAENVRQFFENCSQNLDVNLERVAVCSTPLTGPFSSSTQGFCDYLQQQYLSFDYHAFVIAESIDGMCWAVDKMTDGIYVSCSKSRDSVVFYFNGVKRPEPVKRLIMDKSTSSLGDVVGWLERKLPKNTYNPLESQCQHFAKEFFDKFAKVESWKFDTIIDWTSPLKYLSKVGFDGLLRLLGVVIVYYDVYLLFKESTEDEVNHYQYIGYPVIL
ncbi:uncharacterized protein LOC134815457 [Bolinopsis microptera]|uniref:uncharacterized protein LOC134815457 n=1 Tax=Bolinopsis microptera TaxID=2820187 RepID=UPI003079BD80